MAAVGKLTVCWLFDIREIESRTKGKSMADQKESIRQTVWGPRIFLFGVLLIGAYLILIYGFRITAGTLYTVLRYGGLGFAILGWILWRILKR
jgi:hypothetical protein